MREALMQKNTFLSSEGDNWFTRNKSTENVDVPEGYKFYGKFLKPGQRILEVGCSFGKNLQYFHETVGCDCYGIDPSQKAVEYGKNLYPDIALSVGTTDKLDFPDGFFDFVLFGFCLYLVDRTLLSKTVAEADRVLKDKGFLGITDFDSKYPRKREYRHYEGLASYKMDYSRLFLVFPHFSMADKYCFSHSSDCFVADPGERVASVVIFKDNLGESAYFPQED